MPHGTISTDSGVPLYRQIKDIIRDEILNGTVKSDQSITEAQLLERFGVSRAPIRQALKELTSEGFVYRKQGRGTFPVPGARVERPSSVRTGELYAYLEQAGLKPVSSVRGLGKVVPPEHVREALGLPAKEQLLHFVRLIHVAERPIAEISVYVRVPSDFQPTREELEESGSAFILLDRRYGLLLERVEHAASAIAATPEQGEALGVTEGSPMLLLESTFYIKGGVPTGWRSAIHHAEDFKYRFEESY